MNRFFNSWIFFLSIIAFPFVIAVGWNENFQFFGFSIPGEEFAYGYILFPTISGLLLLLGILKAYRKWMGIAIIRQKSKFVFHTLIDTERRKQVTLYNYLELVFLLLISSYYLYFIEVTPWIALALSFITVEHFLSNAIGLHMKSYGVGISNKAIVRVDREIDAIYFKGLKKITKQQDSLIFDYNNELTLFIPLTCVPPKKMDQFMATIYEKAPKSKVFYAGFEG